MKLSAVRSAINFNYFLIYCSQLMQYFCRLIIRISHTRACVWFVKHHLSTSGCCKFKWDLLYRRTREHHVYWYNLKPCGGRQGWRKK